MDVRKNNVLAFDTMRGTLIWAMVSTYMCTYTVPNEEPAEVVTRALCKTAPAAARQGGAVVLCACAGRWAYLTGSKTPPMYAHETAVPSCGAVVGAVFRRVRLTTPIRSLLWNDIVLVWLPTEHREKVLHFTLI